MMSTKHRYKSLAVTICGAILKVLFHPKMLGRNFYKMGPCKGCLKIAYTSKHECASARRYSSFYDSMVYVSKAFYK